VCSCIGRSSQKLASYMGVMLLLLLLALVLEVIGVY
jgi:hypothetical protein